MAVGECRRIRKLDRRAQCDNLPSLRRYKWMFISTTRAPRYRLHSNVICLGCPSLAPGDPGPSHRHPPPNPQLTLSLSHLGASRAGWGFNRFILPGSSQTSCFRQAIVWPFVVLLSSSAIARQATGIGQRYRQTSQFFGFCGLNATSEGLVQGFDV
jgi:hypothetical protein